MLRTLFLCAILLIVIYVLITPSIKPILVTTTTTTFITTTTIRQTTSASYSSVIMNVPAVDNEGNGVATRLIVETKPGQGRILTDINQLLFWVDTQDSIRTAEKVAQNLTKKDISSVDIVYAIETNASVIGGPSAGAALTIATVAALEGKTLNKEVMITGTINHDGTIGPVGEVLARAKASKDIGTKIFLVPVGQAVQTYYSPEQHCENIGFVRYCTTEYKAEKIDISKDADIEVHEVSNINEALKYFLT